MWSAVGSVGQVPTARAGHAAVMSNGILWVHGGVSAGGAVLGDLWSLDVASNVWTQRPSSGGAPALFLHAAYVSSSGSICFVGGSSIPSPSLSSLLPASSSLVYCFDGVANAWVAPLPGPATGARVGLAAALSSGGAPLLAGGVEGGGAYPSTVQVSSSPPSSSSWLLYGGAPPLAFAASAVSQGILWRFGGLQGPALFSTQVWALQLSPSFASLQRGCEPGYSAPPACNVPVCQGDCWGVGRCIAPDLCECLNGFTGPLCQQQLCSTCSVNLLSLNVPIYFPRAAQKALRCIQTLRTLIASIRASLPVFPETCAQTFQLPSPYPFNLTAISKESWNYWQGPLNQAVQVLAATIKRIQP